MTSDLSHHSLMHTVTDDDYYAAIGRVQDGKHTDDDLNLIRVWAARQEQDRADMLCKLRAYFHNEHASTEVA